MANQRFQKIVFLLILLAVSVHQVISECSGKDSVMYKCPNCNGTEVKDCLDCTGYLNADETHNICFKRKLFNNHDTGGDHDEHYRYLWNDLVGTLVWFLTAGIATACGVGGGGIYVPMGILLLNFSPKPSSGLSQASIFGASLGGLMLNGRNKHPNEKIRNEEGKKDENGKIMDLAKIEGRKSDEEYITSGGKIYSRPRIDYDMALFLAPMEMAGAVLGVLIQKIMPNWLYLMVAGVILAFTSHKTYKKFFATHKAEKETKQKEQEETSGNFQNETDKSDEPDSDNIKKSDPESGKQVTMGDVDITKADLDDENEKLREIYLEQDSRQYPREKLITFLILWIGLILLTFFKGGKGVKSLIGIDCDSPVYGVLIAIQFAWTIGFGAVFGFKLLKQREEREKVNYPYVPSDVQWDMSKLRFYALFTFLAGIVAGLIGIGGGMVLGPLMIVMGIHPSVSSATTATMIVLTSSSVAVLFVTSGLVPWSYAIYFFTVCFIGAFIGKRFIDSYVKKTGKASVLVCILATIIAFATVGCFVIVLIRLAANNWCFEGFKKFCDVKDESTCAATRLLNVFGDMM